MIKRKRAHISLKTKLASALLQMVRPNDSGKFVQIIPYEESKNLSADEIISRFEFHHGILHVHDGPDDPWNLMPKLKHEHKKQSAKIDIPAAAKVRRITAKQEKFRRNLLDKKRRQDWQNNQWQKRQFPKKPKRKKSIFHRIQAQELCDNSE